MRGNQAARILPLHQKVDPAWTALVIVDVQNDFAMPTGACEVSGDDLSNVTPMLERLKVLLHMAREKDVLILHLRMNNDAVYVAPSLAEIFARRGLGKGPCQSGTAGSAFVDGAGPTDSPNEIVITKHRFSGFWGSAIDLILRSNGIKTVVMAGITTEVCVDSTARDAAFRDYSVVMLRDCTSSFSQARHDAAHTLFDRSFGVVAESFDVIKAWSRSNTTTRGWKADTKHGAVLRMLEERAEPRHTALLVIGMAQNLGPSPDPEALRMVTARSLDLLQAARAAGVMIIHIDSDYSDTVSHVGLPAHYRDGTSDGLGAWTLSAAELGPGTAEPMSRPPVTRKITSEFEPLDDEPIVVKHRFSAFQDTDLELLLRANGIQTVVALGQPAECCVDTTAREAATRDYYLIIPEDCVAGVSNSTYRASLSTLRQYFGLVVPSQRLIRTWTLHNLTASSRFTN